MSSETEFTEEDKSEDWKKIAILVLSVIAIALLYLISMIMSARPISPPKIDSTTMTEKTQANLADYGSGLEKYADG